MARFESRPDCAVLAFHHVTVTFLRCLLDVRAGVLVVAVSNVGLEGGCFGSACRFGLSGMVCVYPLVLRASFLLAHRGAQNVHHSPFLTVFWTLCFLRLAWMRTMARDMLRSQKYGSLTEGILNPSDCVLEVYFVMLPVYPRGLRLHS